MSTTTTSYVDLTDTQMLDYAADTDFSMHGSTSSPGWLTVEATMSDATSPAAEPQDAIEVDMEPHGEDEEMHEYEMMGEEMDGMHNDAVEDTELVDIEVIDPSRAVSPTPAVLPTSVPGTVETYVGVVDSTSPERAGESVSAEAVHESTRAAATTAEEHAAADIVSGHDFQHIQAQSPLAFPLVVGGASLEESFVAVAPRIAEGAPEAPAPAEVSVSSEAVEGTEAPPAEPATEAPEGFTNGTHATREDIEAPVFHGSEDSVSHYEGNTAPYDRAGVVYEESAVTYDATTNDAHVQAAHDEQGAHEGTEAAQYEEQTTSGEDPHEISDGVYIDPPPAVLLTLMASGRQLECSLFNQPHTPGSHSPNGYASTSTAGELTLLLHQRPTLYYEPLSHVFDALREEEAVYSLPDLVDDELVLDAYDLDLRIMEDNVFAREVTIHDLNIVHDGSDLGGPLRLRLYTSSPRFITRYRSLRDQISQLTLGLDGEGNGDAEGIEVPPPSAAADSGEYEAQNGESDAENEELQGHEESREELVNGEAAGSTEEILTNTKDKITISTDPTIHEVLAATAEEEHESEDREDDYDEFLDPVDRPEDAHEEYGAGVAAERVERLDADEVHRSAGAEDGSDYTDYVENVEDDDERFGEALPQELGGDSLTDVFYSGTNNAHEADENAILYLEEPVAEDAVDMTKGQEDIRDDFSSLENLAVPDEGLDEFGDLSEHDDLPRTSGADNENHIDAINDGALLEYNERDGLNTDGLSHQSEDQEDAEWDEYEDVDDQAALSKEAYDNDDALSKYSSETLSSTRSKRSRDDEDDDNATTYASPPETPDSKRARVQ